MSSPLKQRILLRARSGAEVGMGHVIRTRAVASQILRLGGHPLMVVDDERSALSIGDRAIPVVTTEECPNWHAVHALSAWLDGRCDWTDELRELGAREIPTFLVEYRGPLRDSAHRVIYPALHYVPDEWDACHRARVLAGADWIPLTDEVHRQPVAIQRDVDLLITFGGSDPFHLTERALEALHVGPNVVGQGGAPRRTVVAIGPHMAARRSAIQERFGDEPGLLVLPPGEALAPWFARSRAALTAVGTTLYELAYLGVRALLLANYDSDKDALAWYAEHGPHLPIGVAGELSQEGLRAGLVAGLAELASRPPVAVVGLGSGSGRLAQELLAA